MSLRLRLMIIIGLSFALLWSATSVWMFLDVRTKFRDALDERLAASARMVAGLVSQLPERSGVSPDTPQNVVDVVAKDGVACEVRLIRGELIARTHNSPALLATATSGYSTRTVDGIQWRVYTLEQGGRRVTTADRIDRRQALLQQIILATVVPFLVAMLGGLMVLWFGIRRGLAPLESIRQTLATREPDALEQVPPAGVPPELAPLVHTINRLLQRVHGAIERERRFTGDAAHELRTPLTAIKTHIQVARLTANEETGSSLEHAEQGVRRLQHTLEQLLTLARIEGPFSFDSETAVRARQIAESAMNDVPPSIRHRIVPEATGADGVVAMPPVLATTALRNLLDNALRYSPAEAPVLLQMNVSVDIVSFAVLDRGPGLAAPDRQRAAQRFWRQGGAQGTGLGLSIVDAIVKRFGGSFQLSERPGGGLLAKIDLPRMRLTPSDFDCEDTAHT